MAHSIIVEAEYLIDKEIKVLNHGFVRLVDYMGSDSRIVEAARVSYGKGTKTVREDYKLIEYLLKNDHNSPFEHVVLEFHCKMPIFIARQWVRHRTARLNEISGRYSVMEDEFYVPPIEQIKLQSKDNKQGRSQEEIPLSLRQQIVNNMKDEQAKSYESYKTLIDKGIARELARVNLPLSLYTQWYWQMDLHNLFNFLRLRLDSHAQWEIREYAKAIAALTKSVVPLAYQAFETHILNGKRFSSIEIEAINKMLKGENNPLDEKAKIDLEKKLMQ